MSVTAPETSEVIATFVSQAMKELTATQISMSAIFLRATTEFATIYPVITLAQTVPRFQVKIAIAPMGSPEKTVKPRLTSAPVILAVCRKLFLRFRVSTVFSNGRVTVQVRTKLVNCAIVAQDSPELIVRSTSTTVLLVRVKTLLFVRMDSTNTFVKVAPGFPGLNVIVP
jgi:hypothetical protein